MKENFLNLNTIKKKFATIALSSTLIIALGAVTTFAASGTKFTSLPLKSITTYSNDEKSMGMLAIRSLAVRSEDGKTSYSTDGGNTWNEGLPEGVDLPKIKDGKPFGGKRLAVKTENGVTKYSTDGGETWSDTPPDDVKILQNKDGSIEVKKNTDNK